MTLSIAQLTNMSRLLDEALPLDAAGRRDWLEKLSPQYSDLAEAMREALLPSEAQVSELDSLDAKPKVGPLKQSRSVSASGLFAGERVGPYELIRQLGIGGMAEVWLARRADGAFKREVALKLPQLALHRKDLEQRFAREREILASLNHPNIAQLFDAGFATDGQPYVALEYVDGTLFTVHCDRHLLSIRARLELFRQVLSAVQYAHANLVIHRDLKPSNILVTQDGQVKLLDFGIAKLLSDGQAKETELTRLSGRALTLDYAAPEQITGAPITTAADVYALGVMLYELLTGERPYRLTRDSRGALEEAILQTEPVQPSRAALSEPTISARATTKKKLVKDLKSDLGAIVLKALKKSPAERYATADAFGKDIDRYFRAETVQAQHDSLAYRGVKFAHRHWISITAASILILTLVGGLAATTYEARIASRQRDAALQAQLRSLTQTAAGRLRDSDVPAALGIILEVLPHRGATRSYTPEALSVFHEARAADAQILALSGHANTVWKAAFSPDGRRIGTASWDKTARIWDAVTGRQLLLLSGHTEALDSIAFSPDGRRVLTASHDKTARIWDAATGKQLMVLMGHSRYVLSAAYSPDGQRIVTASTDKTARIWDAATGKELLQLGEQPGRLVWARFSPDGRRVVTAADDNMARIWDAATGKQIVLLGGHAGRVWSAEFSSDGSRVITASEDKTARLWDAATGREILRFNGHADRVNTASFSPDGKRVVTASDDRTIRIWDSASGQQLKLLSGLADPVWCAVFSPDGRRLVSTSTDKSARVWDATDGEIVRFSGHTSWVLFAGFSPDAARVITTSKDNTARLWDAATGMQLVLLNGHTDPVNYAAFSPDGRRVVTASDDQTARIWDTSSGQELLRLSGNKDRVSSAVYSPDGTQVVTAVFDNNARIYDAATGQQSMLLSGHTDRVETAAFSPDGRRVVTASRDKTARIWDAATGRQIMLLAGHTKFVASAEFSPDGQRIVTSSYDSTARVWDAATGRQILLLGSHAGPLNSAVYSPNGRFIATASSDKTARIWDAATGQEITLFGGHRASVSNAAFSPDGDRLITASTDGTARIWDAHGTALADQITWSEAAQLDPLPSAERFQLGLPAALDVRQWPADQTKCDQSAAAPYDPDRGAQGVVLEQIVVDIALAACSDSRSSARDQGRLQYQHGRSLEASGDLAAARQAYGAAVALGYRSAAIDLGRLDPSRAPSLFEQAWRQGVPIAAYELGRLYEQGVLASEHAAAAVIKPDPARAWAWYGKGADTGEPNALARFAERAEATAADESDESKKSAALLRAFSYFAAACERARREDWPDEAWKDWRYRRASLARMLAREGMMAQVAEEYATVLDRWSTRTPPLVQRIRAAIRR